MFEPTAPREKDVAMCFSAGASFAAGSVLIPAGVYCTRRAMACNRNWLWLAITPVVFGIQQICEGFVWRGLQQGDPALVRAASLAFLFFALVFWPVWTPLTALFFDGRLHRRKFVLLIAAAFVAIVATSLVYLPLFFAKGESLRVDVAVHSIRYQFGSMIESRGLPRLFWQFAYVALVTLPFLASRHRSLQIFGLVIAVASLAAQLAFWYAFVSIWCAFAAALSTWLCWLFHELPATPPAPVVPRFSGSSG
jgi:hypothetical protein